jgi:hypothetical protein
LARVRLKNKPAFQQIVIRNTRLLAVAIARWPATAQVVRGLVLALKDAEYVQARSFPGRTRSGGGTRSRTGGFRRRGRAADGQERPPARRRPAPP